MQKKVRGPLWKSAKQFLRGNETWWDCDLKAPNIAMLPSTHCRWRGLTPLKQAQLNNGGSVQSLALLKIAIGLPERGAGGQGWITHPVLKMSVFWVLFFSVL
jgi:hypothetical protein